MSTSEEQKKEAISLLINVVMSLLTDNNLRLFADHLLDFVESKVKSTDTSWDDTILLPLCQKVRSAFGISDN